MAVSLIAHQAKGAVSQTSSVSIGTLNITGATLLIACVCSLLGTANVPTDGVNTYLQGNTVSVGGRLLTWFYKIAPTTSSSYTATFTGTPNSGFLALGVAFAAFDPVSVTFDKQSAGAGNSSGTTVQGGTLTPAATSNLYISLAGCNFNGSFAVDSGLSIADSELDGSSGAGTGSALAWLEQATATAKNPIWTAGSNTATIDAMNAVFSLSGVAPFNATRMFSVF